METEETIDKIRQDAAVEIEEIQNKKEEHIRQINKTLQEDTQAFKKEQRQLFESKLAEKVSLHQQEVKQIAEKYQEIYNNKKEELAIYIVSEVLKQYGSK